MDLTRMLSYSGATLCVGLAGITLVLKRRSVPWLFFALGMLLLGADDALGGLILRAASLEDVLLWQKLRLAVVAFFPVPWLIFSLCYARGNYREFLRKWRTLLAVAFGLPLIAFAGFNQKLIKGPYSEGEASLFIRLGPAGKII